MINTFFNPVFFYSLMCPTRCYTTYSAFLSRYFEGKVQKLPLDVGSTCPVRDGRIAHGGCAFCNGRSFVPRICGRPERVRQQLEAGKHFFLRKMPRHQSLAFLAYFQTGSNTYRPVAEMEEYVAEALSVDGVRGVVFATRPDCIDAAWLDFLRDLQGRTFVMVELGVESLDNDVLRMVGRGHDAQASRAAVHRLSAAGIPVGAHFILGLPGESRESMLRQAGIVSRWPVDVVKLHQLQILKGARLAADHLRSPARCPVFELDDYVELVADYLERLDSRIAVERFVSQSPADALIAPRWGVKSDEVVRRVERLMEGRGTRQGVLCGHK